MSGERIDRKFSIQARCREHGHEHTEWTSVLFLAKDKALPATLRFYLGECRRIGADQRQLDGIILLISRVERFQAEHPGLVKIPDVDAGEQGDAIVAPNEA